MSVNQNHINKIITIAKSYGVKRLILFGSAKNDPDKARDIDLACDGVNGWKLYEFAARIEEELEIPLDIVPLKPSSRLTAYIEENGYRLL